MESSFDVAISYILHDEGGYAERENEPGGAGNRGISFQLFKEMWKKDGKPGVPTFEDLKKLDDVEAARLYHTYVFPLVHFTTMPVGLDYVMVNTATMQGPTGAIKILQESLGIPITGKLEPPLDKAMQGVSPYRLVAGMLMLQAKLKMNDNRVGTWMNSKGKDMHGFGPGWGNRLWLVWNRAVNLIEGK